MWTFIPERQSPILCDKGTSNPLLNVNGMVTSTPTPHCETDITFWSLLIKATMTFRAELEFD